MIEKTKTKSKSKSKSWKKEAQRLEALLVKACKLIPADGFKDNELVEWWTKKCGHVRRSSGGKQYQNYPEQSVSF